MQLGDAPWRLVIEIERRILAAPGVVTPVDDREFVVALHEDRSVIPAPRLVTRDAVIRDVRTIADGSSGDGLDLLIADGENAIKANDVDDLRTIVLRIWDNQIRTAKISGDVSKLASVLRG